MKPVGPCIFYPKRRLSEGQSRVLVLAQEQAMWVPYFVSKQWGKKFPQREYASWVDVS